MSPSLRKFLCASGHSLIALLLQFILQCTQDPRKDATHYLIIAVHVLKGIVKHCCVGPNAVLL